MPWMVFFSAVLDGAEIDRDRHHASLLNEEAQVFTAQITVAVGILAQLA